jgi:hypothetical protein
VIWTLNNFFGGNMDLSVERDAPDALISSSSVFYICVVETVLGNA